MSDAHQVESVSVARPRVWPTLLVLLAGLPGLVVGVGVIVVIAAAIDGVSVMGADGSQRIDDWILEIAPTPKALVMLLPQMAALCALALFLAAISPMRVTERLDLRATRVGGATIALCLLGTLGVQFTVTQLSEILIDEPSEALLLVTAMLIEPTGWYGALVLVVASVGAGFSEELFFRGYVQSRLVAAWGAARGLIVPTLGFASMHFDVQHSLAVLPLGLWFGLVAWHTRSTWTAIACHTLNNFVAIVLARAGWPEEFGGVGAGVSLVATTALLGCAALALRRSH